MAELRRDLEPRLLYAIVLLGLAGLFYLAAVRDSTVIEAQPHTVLSQEDANICVAEHWAAGMKHIAAVKTCAALAAMSPAALEAALP